MLLFAKSVGSDVYHPQAQPTTSAAVKSLAQASILLILAAILTRAAAPAHAG
jgi:hypothetical protein